MDDIIKEKQQQLKKSISEKKISPEQSNQLKNTRFKNMDDYDQLRLQARANVRRPPV